MPCAMLPGKSHDSYGVKKGERKTESISNAYVQSWNPTGVYLILLKPQWRFSGTGDWIHHLISERQTSWLLWTNVVFYILLTSTLIFFKKKGTHRSCSDPILIHSLFLLRKKCFQCSSWYRTAGHRRAVGIYFCRYATITIELSIPHAWNIKDRR